MKGGFLSQLEIIEDTQKKYEERVFKYEEENGTLWSEFDTLKRSVLQQGQNVTALTDKVKIHEEQIKELVKENEVFIQKFGKDMQKKTAFATYIEELNRELEKYIEKIKKTYAQIVKEKETIKEVSLEVKTRNDKNETEMRQASRKELVTNSEQVQNTANRSKSIIIFGCLEKGISSRVDRVAEEMKIIDKIVGLGEGLNSKENVSGFRRIGKYEKNKNRPLGVTFNEVKNTMEVLRNARKLQCDKFSKHWSVRHDLSKKDREKLKMNSEAKRLNGKRTKEEKNSFFYKVSETGKLVKWYIKTDEQNY
ncbi:DNA double-strand break repair Rad50 ATPase-like [Procambarus clarkii]|uniref:DNA double-strand break repair Rad50 ATPase-like n=1 Tax=Procambarus clarkii TaxID=6728 RepID=UPI003744428D